MDMQAKERVPWATPVEKVCPFYTWTLRARLFLGEFMLGHDIERSATNARSFIAMAKTLRTRLVL